MSTRTVVQCAGWYVAVRGFETRGFRREASARRWLRRPYGRIRLIGNPRRALADSKLAPPSVRVGARRPFSAPVTL